MTTILSRLRAFKPFLFAIKSSIARPREHRITILTIHQARSQNSVAKNHPSSHSGSFCNPFKGMQGIHNDVYDFVHCSSSLKHSAVLVSTMLSSSYESPQSIPIPSSIRSFIEPLRVKWPCSPPSGKSSARRNTLNLCKLTQADLYRVLISTFATPMRLFQRSHACPEQLLELVFISYPQLQIHAITARAAFLARFYSMARIHGPGLHSIVSYTPNTVARSTYPSAKKKKNHARFRQSKLETFMI
ncbi:hypothetical protein MSAN_00503600 [Mycena sanguinolenta]|uniref:Uncharacterized protein n=1 Tax=Mycena sanguinolenta TaxID=230812 RepID=A0A8H6Z982_9AGAR|nr:hypothetical protein MSAN_00503600 [Mycena sanguinolenta]